MPGLAALLGAINHSTLWIRWVARSILGAMFGLLLLYFYYKGGWMPIFYFLIGLAAWNYLYDFLPKLREWRFMRAYKKANPGKFK